MALNAIFEQSFELLEGLSVINSGVERKQCIIEYIKTISKSDVICPDFDDGLHWFNTSTSLSLREQLQKKVVVLDFFTYCCINCMHILPDLKQLEELHPVTDGLVVVGVHSAKFENEKLSSNILSAVLRYNITHPCVNDCEAKLWYALGISVWPTLLVLGPENQVLLSLVGEGNALILQEFVSVALELYKQRGQLDFQPIPIQLSRESLPPSPLLFPGKVCVDQTGCRLAIADTGHHRIVVTDLHGVVQDMAGSEEAGFCDGSLREAKFRAPQGLCWLDVNTLFVADSENHAVRKVDLAGGTVETVVGTGQQGHDLQGGAQGTQQPLSTPWDLALCWPQDGATPKVLFIAMAGTHQIWAYCLEDCTLLKNKHFSRGSCVRFAGSGAEENRNNSYAHNAGFAQPSGLATCRAEYLFVADSESSTIRRVALPSGAVSAVIGGEKDPRNLFAFGDVDGVGVTAKLQHPLGVAMQDEDQGLLLVADSYNHKIKQVNVVSRECSTLRFSGSTGKTPQLSEPGGVSMCTKNGCLYVADTNNHAVKVLDLHTVTLSELPIIFPRTVIVSDKVDARLQGELTQKPLTSDNAVTVTPPTLEITAGRKVTLTLALTLAEGLHLTEGAHSAWQILLNDDLRQILDPRQFARRPLTALDDCPTVTFIVPEKWAYRQFNLVLECLVYCCDTSGICMVKPLRFKQQANCTGSDAAESTRTIQYCIAM